MSTRACSQRADPRGAAAPTVLALIIAVPLLLLAVPLLTLLHDLCVPDDRAVAWSPARKRSQRLRLFSLRRPRSPARGRRLHRLLDGFISILHNELMNR